MPDKPRKPRFNERRDDDDDDPPRKRRRSRDDDDDDRPLKRKKAGGSTLPLLLGGAALLVLIFACCGVGGYFAFFRGGASPLGIGNHFEITSASLTPSFGSRGSTLSLAYDTKSGVENTENYWVVLKANGKKHEQKMVMFFVAPGGRGSQGIALTELGNPAPPYEVWIEQRKGGSAKVVSNTLWFR